MSTHSILAFTFIGPPLTLLAWNQRTQTSRELEPIQS
jgi:hypothetical protein